MEIIAVQAKFYLYHKYRVQMYCSKKDIFVDVDFFAAVIITLNGIRESAKK